jgi:hypothetical protein
MSNCPLVLSLWGTLVIKVFDLCMGIITSIDLYSFIGYNKCHILFPSLQKSFPSGMLLRLSVNRSMLRKFPLEI